MSNSDQNGTDRLSSLPEPILLHILSFVPTETAATTCVLSKTWQFLWTSVLNLDFDQSRTHRTALIQNYHDDFSCEEYEECRSFANFVTRVLFLRKEWLVRRFRLKCNQCCDPSDLDLWVSYAIAHNVQELDLRTRYDSGDTFMFRFPQQSCKTLVVLKLKSVLIVDKVSFPVLKILHLKNAQFENQEFKFLPSGFLVLEELVIFGSIDTSFEFCLPKLRSLAITAPWDLGLVRMDCGLIIKIMDCPALTHLVVNDSYSRELHLENLLSLDEADIKISRYRDRSYGRYLMNVIKSVSNVRILRLSLPTLEEIELGSNSFFLGDDIPVFHNLVQFELALECCAWEIMILMLQKFKNLESLTLHYQGLAWEGFGRRVQMKELMQQMHVPNCLTSHLTTFCFRNFEGRDDEMKVTRYILKNSPRLQNVTILFPSSLRNDEDSIRRTLCKFPRGSKGCQFKFDHLQSSDSDNENKYLQSSDSDNENEYL